MNDFDGMARGEGPMPPVLLFRPGRFSEEQDLRLAAIAEIEIGISMIGGRRTLSRSLTKTSIAFQLQFSQAFATTRSSRTITSIILRASSPKSEGLR